MFNKQQKIIISEIVDNSSNPATVKNIIVNLFEVIRCGCKLETCLQSSRFKGGNAGELEFIIAGGYKYKLIGKAEDGEVNNAYVIPERRSILECLLGNTKEESIIKYVSDNYERMIEVFKKLELINNIIEFTGNSGCKQFKTKNGFIDIRCAKTNPTVNSNTILINLYYIQPKRVLVTHNDLDGIACVILAHHNNINFERIYTCQRTHLTPEFAHSLEIFDEVVVTDISFGENKNDNMVEFDHHDKDEDHCGSWLFYNNFIPKKYHNKASDEFVELVDTYDNWRINDKFEKAKQLNSLFIHYTKDVKGYEMHEISDGAYKDFISQMNHLLYSEDFTFNPLQMKFINNMKDKTENVISSSTYKIKTTKRGEKYMFISFYNDLDDNVIAHALIEKYNLDFIGRIYGKGNKCSLRSNTFDLSKINNFQGHSHAGTCLMSDLEDYIN